MGDVPPAKSSSESRQVSSVLAVPLRCRILRSSWLPLCLCSAALNGAAPRARKSSLAFLILIARSLAEGLLLSGCGDADARSWKESSTDTSRSYEVSGSVGAGLMAGLPDGDVPQTSAADATLVFGVCCGEEVAVGFGDAPINRLLPWTKEPLAERVTLGEISALVMMTDVLRDLRTPVGGL